MPTARALVILGAVAVTLSGIGLIVAMVVLFAHGLHRPREDLDLYLGLVGLVAACAAVGGSIALLLTGMAAGHDRSSRTRDATRGRLGD